MFRIYSCPSSEVKTTAVAGSGLPSELGDSSAAVATSGLPLERGGSSVVGRGRSDRTDHDQQHKLPMMSMRMLETC